MKKTFQIFGLLALTIFISGCAVLTGDTNTSDRQETIPTVAATIFPLYDITRIIAGEDIEVKLILPPGTSPHTFDPTPQVLKELSNTEHIFAIGHDIDTWAVDLSKGIGEIPVTVVDDGITLRTFGEGPGHEDEHEEELEHEEDGHDHEEGAEDPHYWLDPDNAGIIAENVSDTLSELYPEHAKKFEARATVFGEDIADAKKEWNKTLSRYDTPKIITFHDAFGYFAEHFNINVVATVEPFAGKEPTPQYIKQLNEIVEHENPLAIFVEPQLSSNAVSALAGDLALPIGILDPIGGRDNRQSYIDLMTYNIDTLVHTIEK